MVVSNPRCVVETRPAQWILHPDVRLMLENQVEQLVVFRQAIKKVGGRTTTNVREQRHLVPGQKIVDVSEAEITIDLLELEIFYKVW